MSAKKSNCANHLKIYAGTQQSKKEQMINVHQLAEGASKYRKQQIVQTDKYFVKNKSNKRNETASRET